jgi:hypothetical protein
MPCLVLETPRLDQREGIAGAPINRPHEQHAIRRRQFGDRKRHDFLKAFGLVVQIGRTAFARSGAGFEQPRWVSEDGAGLVAIGN